MTEYDGFRLERDAARGVATITLDVPGKFNRVSMLARDELAALFAELDRDDSVRFVVLTGAGGQFTAGGDIAGFLTRSPWVVSQLAKNVAAPERCSKPVIAKLQGYVLGIGLELALACDFRIASDDVQLALPEATIGMIPGSGGTQRLARMVGLGRAKDIVMRGRRVMADEALALGLVTEVVDADDLDAAVDRADRRDLAPLPARARDGEAGAQRCLRRAAPPRPRAGRPCLRPPAADARLSRGRRRVRREAAARVHRRVAGLVGERPGGALGCAHPRCERFRADEKRLRPHDCLRVGLGLPRREVDLRAGVDLRVVVLDVRRERLDLLALVRIRALRGARPPWPGEARSRPSAGRRRSPCHRASPALRCRIAPGRRVLRAARRALTASARPRRTRPSRPGATAARRGQGRRASTADSTHAPTRGPPRAPSRPVERRGGGSRSRARPSRAG